MSRSCFFFRLAPSSSEAAGLESDSLEMGAMVAAVDRESLTNPSYFSDVFTAALTIAARKARPAHAEQGGGWQRKRIFGLGISRKPLRGAISKDVETPRIVKKLPILYVLM